MEIGGGGRTGDLKTAMAMEVSSFKEEIDDDELPVVSVWRRSLDLQDHQDFETADNSAYLHRRFSREMTPTRELRRGNTESKMESPPPVKKKSPPPRGGGKPPAGIKAPAAEIEEFFAAAEKYEQKRFQEKYNYDIVKDVPLEGRYQWVRLA